jgi:cytochrome bd ubiquinol oxidase subunit I
VDNAALISHWQFALTASYHYLFPQLTMGLALLIVILKSLALWKKDETYQQATRFWVKLFAISFVMDVVTGIPLEFQFGTNWAAFSRYAGNIIGQTLAMEGAFAFFLESAFLGVLLFGERRLGQRWHWVAAVMVFLGTWVSGFFIIASNAWLQNPVGYVTRPGGLDIADYRAILFNPWILPQYLHTMCGAVITGSFAMAGLGAYYMLLNQHVRYAQMFLKLGVIAGVIAALFSLYPSGDLEGHQVTFKQPVKLAAMEGLFHTEHGPDIVVLGQPDVERGRIDNPITIPHALSFLTYRRWNAEVKGLDAFAKDQWPDSIAILYYGYHIMVGLGTIFIAIMGAATFLLWRRRLWESRWMLWILMLAVPFPFIANIAGWLTAEVGRQPWVVYNLLRTAEGHSPTLSSGNALFTLIGFTGLYLLLGLLYIVLVVQKIGQGPDRPAERSEIPDALIA